MRYWKLIDKNRSYVFRLNTEEFSLFNETGYHKITMQEICDSIKAPNTTYSFSLHINSFNTEQYTDFPIATFTFEPKELLYLGENPEIFEQKVSNLIVRRIPNKDSWSLEINHEYEWK